MASMEPPTLYAGSFWSRPYKVSLIRIRRTLRGLLLVQTLQGELDPHLPYSTRVSFWTRPYKVRQIITSRYDLTNQSLTYLIKGEYSVCCCFQAGAPKRLLKSQEQSLLKDIREAIDKRVENRIATAR